MKKILSSLLVLFAIVPSVVFAQSSIKPDLRKAFLSPPESAKPWVFWYWLHGAVSPQGITKDLEAMSMAGIGGAYLMPIKDTTKPSIYQPAARQLSPQWWSLVTHSMNEAQRLGLKLALHVSDGFALAGGPWITPEKSMQKVVWTQMNVQGGKLFADTLPTPKMNEGYYRDIAILAFPSLQGAGISTKTVKPVVTTNKGVDGQFLVDPLNTKNFTSEDSCWIQYSFEKPFTLRSLVVRSKTNYQSNRLIIETSNDGVQFTRHVQLESPRHGWQDWDSDYTHAIEEVTAKYFRFIYSKEGSEPGAEDLDAAKWRPVLKIMGIELSSEPRIHQYEGKNGEVWRVSKSTTKERLQTNSFVSLKSIVDVTKYVDGNGRLNWTVPAGNWTIIRIGHTSTGHKNETAGGGKGLECDKFDVDAITLQFNKWFGEFYKQCGPVADSVVKIFHVDSWECGSQNWSLNFGEEFKKRRGYDLHSYLPLMAGIPVENLDVSEKFLHDVRATINDLLNDKFYGTLQNLAHQKGVLFSAESVAPTMLSDGMQHYSKVDLPMGEFWLRSPTHDKPNDMLDAISGAHIYGKNIVQAEAFTQLRMQFDEHPGNIKTLADRNFALGINKLVFHVFMHNPWLDKKPGVTLDPIGLLFQRDQTWWKQGKAFVDYVKRCQALLQSGNPVVDIAFFTGEEYPRRSLLPERLVNAVPGLFGEEAAQWEQQRLMNKGQTVIKGENGISYVANTTNAQSWLDPLNGYAYDSYNKDALMNLSSVKDGKLQLSTGASYGLLVVPGANKLSPNGNVISDEAGNKIKELRRQGANILVMRENSLLNKIGYPDKVLFYKSGYEKNVRGRLLFAPYSKPVLNLFGIEPDFIASESNGQKAKDMAWTHRTGDGFDIYFISNQKDSARRINLSLRVNGMVPEIWDAVSGEIAVANNWKIKKGRTELPVLFDKNASVFIVLQQVTKAKESPSKKADNWISTKPLQQINADWKVSFDEASRGGKKTVLFTHLTDLSQNADSNIRYYSGTASYSKTISYHSTGNNQSIWLNMGKVYNLAEVFVNGISCGIAWTAPYRVDITKALEEGENLITIEVTNTWANRMIGDSRLLPEKRMFNAVYPFKMDGKPLLPAGLIGPVVLEETKK